MHISSSYAKILGETNVQPREIPRSGSKAKDGERKKKERRVKVGNNNSQLRIAAPPWVVNASRLGQNHHLNAPHPNCNSPPARASPPAPLANYLVRLISLTDRFLAGQNI